MYSSLSRKLSIGFMDSISLEKRRQLIDSDMPLDEILALYPHESTHEQEASDVIEWMKCENNHIWWYTDPYYPVFEPIENNLPYMLFVKGTIPSGKYKYYSIVGTRNTDNAGFQASYKLGLECGANKICVVSGMADGCDQSAMNGAVDALFPCYGILGCGLDIDYPKYSSNLKKRVIETGGALISRFAPHTQPFKQNFPNRNMIIAAMGQVLIVVQAPKKSGALITSDFALQMGKDVFVSETGVGKNWNRIGSSNLVFDGARTIHSIDGISSIRRMAFEVEFADKNTYRFGNKLYIFRDIRR